MYPYSPWRLARGLKGRLLQSGPKRLIERLSSDSRNIEKGAAYIALPGERFDGEAFYGQARKAGASALIGPKAPRWPGIASIRVADSLSALQALARDQRALFSGPLVGITGSNGKTGAKECLSFLLGPEETLSSPGNWNNHIGLPLTLLGLQRKHRAAVLEMGMNHPGELSLLASIARPDLALELNVGDAHLGFFRTRQAVAKAKEELLWGMGPSGIAVLNGDDPLVRAMGRRFQGRQLRFGLEAQNDLRLRVLEDHGVAGAKGILSFDGRTRRLNFTMGGRARQYQALASIAAALALGKDLKDLVERYEAFRPQSKMRQEIRRWKGMNFIVDAYNASPQSMSAGLELLKLSAPKGRALAVLGEMLELGPAAARLHRALGRQAKAAGLRALACVGPHAEAMRQSFGPKAQAFAKEALEPLLHWLREEARAGDWILIKASRGMALERVFQMLTERG